MRGDYRKRTFRALLVCVLGLSLAACVIFKRPLVTPGGDDAAILLMTTEMPQPISGIARHAWFAVRKKGQSKWRRIEVGGFGRGPLKGVSGERLHAIWRGKKAEKAIECLIEHGPAAKPRGKYLPWPGPNSNTFVDKMLRKCNLHADLPSTAIGKDYRGLAGFSWTSGGTGFQFETPIFGFKLGLTEGIEIHLFAFAIGIDLWPPAIIIPVGPGRIGFEDR